jgi:hypothetical protein
MLVSLFVISAAGYVLYRNHKFTVYMPTLNSPMLAGETLLATSVLFSFKLTVVLCGTQFQILDIYDTAAGCKNKRGFLPEHARLAYSP